MWQIVSGFKTCHFSRPKPPFNSNPFLSNSVSDEFANLYLATGLTHGEAEPEETEDLRLRRVSLADAYAAVESGQITDSLTVAAIYKVVLMEMRGEV